MNFCVSRVPERVETTGPGRDPSARGQDDEHGKGNDECCDDECTEEELELFARYEFSYGFDKGDELEQAEDAWKGRCEHELTGYA